MIFLPSIVFGFFVCGTRELLAMRVPSVASRRRALLDAALLAALGSWKAPAGAYNAPQSSAMKVTWGPFKDLSVADMESLDLRSQDPTSGKVLPSGTRVIDLVEGPGPVPAAGDHVYVHYKVWPKGFRSGKAADVSFFDERPFEFVLGEGPTERLPAAVAEGLAGMAEGGWRRVVIPDGYGDAGLRRISRDPFGRRYVGAKAPFVMQPHEPAYVDLVLVDGGSGRCSKILHPPDVSDKDARKIKSLTCSYKYEVF